MNETLKKYVAFTKKWEGGLSRDVNDSASSYPCPTPHNGKNGYHTNIGITYAVWKAKHGTTQDHRFLNMSDEDWFEIFKKGYWDTMRADEFNNMSIGIFVTGMCWGSGKRQAVKSLQQAIINCGVSVEKDGLLGNKTISAANSIEPRKLFDALTSERERFFRAISKGKNAKFLKGWLNRLEDYKRTFRP
jgi:lysozyme family protein